MQCAININRTACGSMSGLHSVQYWAECPSGWGSRAGWLMAAGPQSGDSPPCSGHTVPASSRRI